jgi:hypothetical protein
VAYVMCCSCLEVVIHVLQILEGFVMLLCVLEVVESVRYVLELLEVMRCIVEVVDGMRRCAGWRWRVCDICRKCQRACISF